MEVSVIVPIYNVEQYLRQCLTSILDQTFKDFELILIDDGSDDDSKNVVDEYCAIDDRIKSVHKLHEGVSDARNCGLDLASGKYICFIDSDDWIENTYLEELLNLIKSNEADVSACSYIKSDGNADIIQPTDENITIETGIEALDNLYGRLYGEYVVVWNKLYKKEMFENLRFPTGMIHEDEVMSADILCKAKKIVKTDRVLYNYRVNNAKSIMSAGYSLKRLDILKAMEMRMETYKSHGLTDYYEKDGFKYLYKILLNELEIKKLGGDNKAIIKELKEKYWKKYKESLGFDWTLKRKAGMLFFGLFPKAYLLRYKSDR